jgi:hypothetical protein
MSMADAASGDITVNNLDCPNETVGHIASVVHLEADSLVIVYASKDNGEVELVKRGDAYRVRVEDIPSDPDAVNMGELRWFDTLDGAVAQLAEWMGIDVKELLDTGTVDDPATIGVTVDDLDCPRETANHTFSVLHVKAEKPVIVYTPKNGDGDSDDDGRVELITVDGSYQVTVTRDIDGETVQEREVFDTLGAAVKQLATWMSVDIEVFLDGGDVDG